VTDNDDLKLPPRRPMPPEVHDRVRARVFGEVESPLRARLNRARPPLAVAASVAVLAAGAAIVAQSVHGGDTPPVAPTTTVPTPQPPPIDPAAANANMDRCWAAVLAAGKAADVPDRATWRAVMALPYPNDAITAVRADGRPLFCETTPTAVTVSDPNAQPTYANGTGTAALLITRSGIVAGVVDPSWYHLITEAFSPGGSKSEDVPFVQDGIFVTRTNNATGPGARFTARRAAVGEADHRLLYRTSTSPPPGQTAAPLWAHPELDLPLPAPPLVAVTDHPAPVADRSSEAGAFLGECIAKSDTAVVDPDFWRPVVLAGAGSDRAVLARLGDRIATCATSEASHTFSKDAGPSKPGDPIQYVIRFGPNARSGPPYRVIALGTLRADVATMEVLGPNQQPMPVSVANGGFSMMYLVDPAQPPDRVGFTAVLRDQSGKEVYRGLF
jgi:hypothetical protein